MVQYILSLTSTEETCYLNDQALPLLW